MSIAPATMHHLALTVRNPDASVEWYGRVFGLTRRMDLPHPGGSAQMLSDDAWQLVIALHRHESGGGDAFAESHTRLDHAGLAVPIRDDLLAWQSHLETQGVVRAERADRPLTQSPIADEPYGSVLVFRGPDDIRLELFAPPPADE